MSDKTTTTDALKPYTDFFNLYMVNTALATTAAKGWKKPKCTPELLNFIHQSQDDHVIKAACLLLGQVPLGCIDFSTVIEIFANLENNRVIQYSLVPILEAMPKDLKGVELPDIVSVERLLSILHHYSSNVHICRGEIEAIVQIIIKLIDMIPDTRLDYRDTIPFLTNDYPEAIRNQVGVINDRISIDSFDLEALLSDLLKYWGGLHVATELQRLIDKIPSEQLNYDTILTFYHKREIKVDYKKYMLALLGRVHSNTLNVQRDRVLAGLNSLP